MFGKRADGKRIRDISITRRFMPYLSPRRNSSLVYYTTEIEVGPALEYVAELNRERAEEERITFFHLFLRSLGIGLSEREGVNRFVAGGKLWQRRGVWITYSAKQAIVDGSPVITLKHRFDPDEGLDAMSGRLVEELRARRQGRESRADKEVNLAVGDLGKAVVALARGAARRRRERGAELQLGTRIGGRAQRRDDHAGAVEHVDVGAVAEDREHQLVLALPGRKAQGEDPVVADQPRSDEPGAGEMGAQVADERRRALGGLREGVDLGQPGELGSAREQQEALRRPVRVTRASVEGGDDPLAVGLHPTLDDVTGEPGAHHLAQAAQLGERKQGGLPGATRGGRTPCGRDGSRRHARAPEARRPWSGPASRREPSGKALPRRRLATTRRWRLAIVL